MYPEEFQKRLRDAFDARVTVKRDKADHCWVVWDVTRSGVPYPAYKVACETTNPQEKGTPRDPADRDILALRKMNWAEKYKGRKGAVTEIMEETYVANERRMWDDTNWRIEETIREKVRPKMLWRAGVRNTISLAPLGNRGGAGGMKNRLHEEKRKIKSQVS